MQDVEKSEEMINVDILGSIEFDLSGSLIDLIWHIKSIKKDIDNIKKYLKLQ